MTRELLSSRERMAQDYELLGETMPEFKSSFSLQDYLESIIIRVTRMFAGYQWSTKYGGAATYIDAMIPIADLFNHGLARNAEWSF